jgi:hypothetical protein
MTNAVTRESGADASEPPQRDRRGYRLEGGGADGGTDHGGAVALGEPGTPCRYPALSDYFVFGSRPAEIVEVEQLDERRTRPVHRARNPG